MHRRALRVAPLALVLAASATTVVVSAGSAQAAVPRCHGLQATIVEPSPGTGVIHGTPGPDVIVASAWSNTIYAGGGDDVVCAGDGADLVYGGRGDDQLYGQRGYLHYGVDDAVFIQGDTLVGGPGDDHLDGGADHRSAEVPLLDTYSWETSPRGVHIDLQRHSARGEGHDTLAAGLPRTAFRVLGSTHGDVIDGSRGRDFIDAGAGPDVVHGRAGVDAITLDPDEQGSGSDADRAWGGPGGDYLGSAGGRDRLNGGAGDDHLETLGSGNDVVRGEQGDDDLTLEVADTAGPQQYDGGPGTDRILLLTRVLNPTGAPSTGDFEMTTGTMSLTLGVVIPLSVRAEQVGLVTPGTSWTVTGTPGDDQLSSALATAGISFRGLAGDDVLEGTDADDVFHGGPGVDRADLRGGEDTCTDVEVHDQFSCELTG